MARNRADALGRKELLALLEGADSLNQTIGLPEVLQRILRLAQGLTGAVAGSVILHDQRKHDLFFAAATGPVEAALPKIRLPVGEGVAGRVFSTGNAVRQDDVRDDGVHYKAVDQRTSFRTTSLICVPLAYGDRRYGVMQLVNKSPGDHGFTAKDEAILTRFAVQATIAIRNAALFERLLAASGLYAAPDVRADIVERMTSASGMPAVREFLTVLFVDLRGSTQLAQQIGTPDRLQRMISDLLAMLSAEVIRHRGIVNKFLGDGLMAVFRREGAAINALRAAFAMLTGFEELVESWRSQTSIHLRRFLGLGIGIVSEEVILGTVGTEDAPDFTVIGTPVNLASALRDAARGDRRVLCCSQTYLHAKALVAEADGPIVFDLRKPTQEHGIEYEVYNIKRIAGGRVQPRAFVSFSQKDRPAVEQALLQPLVRQGIEVVSFADIAADPRRLEGELARCDWFVVVVSPRALHSERVRGEVAAALEHETLSGRIVPIGIERADASKIDPRLGLVRGFMLDAPDAAATTEMLAAQMLAGSRSVADGSA